MKSLEVWRRGYKAEFSPGLGCSKCKVSPLSCLPWDSVGGVGQGRFRILHKSGTGSPWFRALSWAVLWPCILGRPAAWPERLGGILSGAQAGRRSFTVIFWPFLFPFLSPVSLSSPFHLLGGAGSAVWLAGGLHRLGLAGCPSVLLLAVVVVLASLGAGASLCPLLALRPLPLLGCCLWALVLLSPSALSLWCWRSSAVLWCWPAMYWAWVPALGGVGAGAVQAVAVVCGSCMDSNL